MRTEVSSEDATRLASGLVRVIKQLQEERDEAIRLAAVILWHGTLRHEVPFDLDVAPFQVYVDYIHREIARRLAGREGEGTT